MMLRPSGYSSSVRIPGASVRRSHPNPSHPLISNRTHPTAPATQFGHDGGFSTRCGSHSDYCESIPLVASIAVLRIAETASSDALHIEVVYVLPQFGDWLFAFTRIDALYVWTQGGYQVGCEPDDYPLFRAVPYQDVDTWEVFLSRSGFPPNSSANPEISRTNRYRSFSIHNHHDVSTVDFHNAIVLITDCLRTGCLVERQTAHRSLTFFEDVEPKAPGELRVVDSGLATAPEMARSVGPAGTLVATRHLAAALGDFLAVNPVRVLAREKQFVHRSEDFTDRGVNARVAVFRLKVQLVRFPAPRTNRRHVECGR